MLTSIFECRSAIHQLSRRSATATTSTSIVAATAATSLTAPLWILGPVFHVRRHDHPDRFIPTRDAAMPQLDVAVVIIMRVVP